MTLKKIIAYYIIAGGLLGIYLSLDTLINRNIILTKYKLTIIFFLLLYIFVCVSAIIYTTNNNKTFLVTILQAIQILGISEFGFKFVFCAGLVFKIGYQEMGLYYVINLFTAEFIIGKNSIPSFFYINIIPILLIIIINLRVFNSSESK